MPHISSRFSPTSLITGLGFYVENTQWNINNLVEEKVLPPWLINELRHLSPYTTSTLQNMFNK